MSAPNGHGQEDRAASLGPPVPMLETPAVLQLPAARVKELVAALEVPFEPSQIEWRVMNTTKNQRPARGQVVPYANQRAYTDRLNLLLTPAGWTRKYTIHTSANFERSKDQKIVAKVLVSCELTIFGLGSHSATGEEWADDDNAVTSAEAQSFKRASACFGLGRYFYYFVGAWVELDERKRPKTIPQLAGWATPAGWLEGLRPDHSGRPNLLTRNIHARGNGNCPSTDAEMLRQIEGMEEILGKRMYRGLLKTIARVWNPKDIRDSATQQRVLAHMQAAGRGLRRLEVALDRVGPEVLDKLLRARSLRSLNQVDNLSALHEIVCALESATS